MEIRNEYGGFVYNPKEKKYELLFITECSILLAKERAGERAALANQIEEKFELDNVIVMKREVYSCDGPWRNLDCRGPNRRRRSKIERNISTAREIIRAGLLKYKKRKIGARNRGQVENLKKAFKDLEPYGDLEGISDAYAYEQITDAERRRLIKLYEAKEEAEKNAGIYTDQVIEMLERAILHCGDEYGLDED